MAFILVKTVDVSEYLDVFEKDSLGHFTTRNLIYGKNGTGKSTFTKALVQQYKDDYDIKIFNNKKRIFDEDTKLDAIALGQKNKEIQQEVKKIEKKIEEIEFNLNSSKNNQSLEKILQKAEKQYEKNYDELNQFLTGAARKIKNITEPQLVQANYNKNYFENDIESAEKLSDTEQGEQFEILKSEVKELPTKPEFPLNKHELRLLINETNSLLGKTVESSEIIEAVKNDVGKQNFIKTGIEVHTHTNEEGEEIYEDICAFCNNEISRSRWDDLEKVISDEVNILSEKIDSLLSKIKNYQIETGKIKILNTEDFYPMDKETLKLFNEINNEVNTYVNNISNILSKMDGALHKKKLETFQKIKPLEAQLNFHLDKTKEKINKLYYDQKMFGKQIDNNKTNAKKKLKFHEIHKLLNAFGYEKKIAELNESSKNYNNAKENYDEISKDIRDKQEEKEMLISKTRSEAIIKDKINKLLSGLGHFSFELILKKDEQNPDNKGHYIIKGHDKKERGVSELSDGEKNIIAFLYFMISATENEDKEKIIVLDDPVNSNDDLMQYLIIGVIQDFLDSENYKQFFILTHNTNFYLQVVNSKKYKHNNKRYFRLIKNGNHTNLKQIENGKEDLNTLYSELWVELKNAYDNKQSTFMWNTMRRILESFTSFLNNKSSIREGITNKINVKEDRILSLALTKGLHVNSHSGVQTDLDIDTYTVEELKELFKNVFDIMNHSSHFESYWD